MRAFFGVLVTVFLINIIFTSELIMEQKTQALLESKQRMIDYQITEQKRVGLQKEFEKVAESAAKKINKNGKTEIETGIFCLSLILYVNPVACPILFFVDVYQKRATLNFDLVLERENYSVVFQKGGYFE